MFPSTISTFPIVSATDRLNSPSHSALHNSVSSVVTQIQTVIGVEGASSVVGSLEYLIKSPASDGGGHVQTAVKGGTGQTTFTKGDLLVATSPSVLSKFALGQDGQVLVANSSTASGMIWSNPGGTKVSASASIISVITEVETSILSTIIAGSTLGSSNALKATMYLNNLTFTGNSSILAKATYGGATIASIMVNATGAFVSGSVSGTLQYTLLANNSANLQRGILILDVGGQKTLVNSISSVGGLHSYNMNVASVASAAPQVMGVTLKISDAGGGSGVNVDATTIERIV